MSDTLIEPGGRQRCHLCKSIQFTASVHYEKHRRIVGRSKKMTNRSAHVKICRACAEKIQTAAVASRVRNESVKGGELE